MHLPEPVAVTPPKTSAGTCGIDNMPTGPADLDKLQRAVGRYETGYCTSPNSPTANARNNCHGIMVKYKDGSRELRYFATKGQSAEAFKAIWANGYGGRMPTLQDARRYSGNERACTWLATVIRFYNEE